MTGGIAGIGLAVALGAGVEAYAADSGQSLFFFSLRLLVGALVFSLLLGGVAAAYATLRIVRVSPAEAIRRGT